MKRTACDICVGLDLLRIDFTASYDAISAVLSLEYSDMSPNDAYMCFTTQVSVALVIPGNTAFLCHLLKGLATPSVWPSCQSFLG